MDTKTRCIYKLDETHLDDGGDFYATELELSTPDSNESVLLFTKAYFDADLEVVKVRVDGFSDSQNQRVLPIFQKQRISYAIEAALGRAYEDWRLEAYK